MKRLVWLFALCLTVVNASATSTYKWKISGSSTFGLATGSSCGDVLTAVGKSTNYVCGHYGYADQIPRTETLDTSMSYIAVHPQYGAENYPITYQGPGLDICEAPRYTGPDTSKPPGQQCERAACVSGDSSGSYKIPIGYQNSAGDIVQYIQHVDTASICADLCIAVADKAAILSNPNLLTCTSGAVDSNGMRLNSCTAPFKDTATKCTSPYSESDVPVPYDPNPPPPPPSPPSCGGSGQPACYPGGTCGAVGQPACTGGDGSGPGGTSAGGGSGGGSSTVPPTCGVTGKPACATDGICGGTGQPSCAAGDGSGTPGPVGSCGGMNQPSCKVELVGDGSTGNINGDLSELERQQKSGMDGVGGISVDSIGLFDWFPRIPTASCVNPQVPDPTNGVMRDFPICGAVNTFSKLVSAVICVFCMLGMVAQIQTSMRS